jgi:hypothetical protein
LTITGSMPLPLSCGATAALVTQVGPPDTIQFTGGQVAPGQTCTVDITVQTASLTTPGTYTYPNSPVTLTSNEAAPVTAGPVTWTVQVSP